MAAPNMKVLLNVSVIVIGVAIASFGELKFELFGFLGTFFPPGSNEHALTDVSFKSKSSVSLPRL
jgi:hypothetical protein